MDRGEPRRRTPLKVVGPHVPAHFYQIWVKQMSTFDVRHWKLIRCIAPDQFLTSHIENGHLFKPENLGQKKVRRSTWAHPQCLQILARGKGEGEFS
eukprot:gene25954-biopygen12177